MKKKKKLWVWGIILVCGICAGVYVKKHKSITEETMVVKTGEIKQYVEDTALVKCIDAQKVYIDYQGKISDIKYSEGDSVKKGDILLTLDKGDLELQLKDANARVDAAKAQLKGTDLVNYANKIEIDKTNVEKAKVAYDTASSALENTKALYKVQAVSKDDLDKSEAVFNAASQDLKAANLLLSEDEKGAPQYLKDNYMAQFEQAINARDIILSNIEKLNVKSPMDGVVLEKLAEKNSTVAAGTEVFQVGNTEKLKLEAKILSDDIYKIKIGNDVEILSKSGETIMGKVTKIAPEAKAITSNLGVNETRVVVTIEVSDGDGTKNVLASGTSSLKPGYSMDIKIITAYEKDKIVVPDSAVFDYKGSSAVLVVQHGKNVIRQIKKGLESDDQIEVIEGLKAGETILVKPSNGTKGQV